MKHISEIEIDVVGRILKSSTHTMEIGNNNHLSVSEIDYCQTIWVSSKSDFANAEWHMYDKNKNKIFLKDYVVNRGI